MSYPSRFAGSLTIVMLCFIASINVASAQSTGPSGNFSSSNETANSRTRPGPPPPPPLHNGNTTDGANGSDPRPRRPPPPQQPAFQTLNSTNTSQQELQQTSDAPCAIAGRGGQGRAGGHRQGPPPPRGCAPQGDNEAAAAGFLFHHPLGIFLLVIISVLSLCLLLCLGTWLYRCSGYSEDKHRRDAADKHRRHVQPVEYEEDGEIDLSVVHHHHRPTAAGVAVAAYSQPSTMVGQEGHNSSAVVVGTATGCYSATPSPCQ